MLSTRACSLTFMFPRSFDLFTKFLLVVGIWWLFFMLSLLAYPALVYISKVFNLIEGPLIFCVAMCRTRVAFLFKRWVITIVSKRKARLAC